MRKITRSPSGCIGGAAGDIVFVNQFCQWIEAGAAGEPPSFEEDMAGLLVDPDGRVFWWNGKSVLTEMHAPFHAEGMGRRFAIGAMAMGADAHRAVEVAAQYDMWTGGGIDVLRLGG